MTDIVSKQGKIEASEEKLFEFLSDLRNLDSFIPHEKVQNWESDEESCSFTVPQVGQLSLRITAKEPHKMIKVEPEGGSTPFSFSFFVQIKQVDENDTRMKLTLRAELNVMMKTMFAGPLKKGLDQIVDTLSGFKLPTKEV
ncbi:MAG: SRPBCC family protein [Bacteroidota bacterium]|nr:SRPBCC family protein [Bacteroidota bacterium]